MNQFREKISGANKAGLETLRNIVNASFQGIGELTVLNLSTARRVIERNAADLEGLFKVRDRAGLVQLRNDMTRAATEQTLTYSRRSYEICSDATAAFNDVLENQFGLVCRGLSAGLEKGLPGPSSAFNAVLGSVKSLVAAGMNRTNLPVVKSA